MSKTLVYKHYRNALAQWPVDLLRPEVSFQKAMQQRIQRRLIPLNTDHSDGESDMFPTLHSSDRSEAEQVNVLYSFLENRYTQNYPVSQNILKPLSNPTYYESLIRELQEAPKRSWLAGIFNRWKGYIRLS